MASFVGRSCEDATRLVDDLMALITQDQFVYTHRWTVHDLVIWDNRRVLHRARPYDADGVRRVMHRATVAGDGPLVEDGKILPVTVRRRAIMA